MLLAWSLGGCVDLLAGGPGDDDGPTEVCDNGIDDDGDRMIDCRDFASCIDDLACTEDCLSMVDLNDNGLIGCADPFCASHPACRSKGDGQSAEEDCDNCNVDEDGDGAAGCADLADCSDHPPCREICDDGVDNNGNGFIDCFDVHCALNKGCQP